MKNKMAILNDFISAIENDSRITTAHISLFLVLWEKAVIGEHAVSVRFFKNDLLPLCRISSRSTFHKVIKQLHEYGYIVYAPSFNRFKKSRVNLIGDSPAGHTIRAKH